MEDRPNKGSVWEAFYTIVTLWKLTYISDKWKPCINGKLILIFT